MVSKDKVAESDLESDSPRSLPGSPLTTPAVQKYKHIKTALISGRRQDAAPQENTLLVWSQSTQISL